MKDWKRILSSVLVFCMLLSLGPAAFAAEDTNGRVSVGDGDTVTVGNVTVTTNGNAVWAYDGATVNVEGDVYQQAVDSEAEYNHINPVGASGSGSSSEVSVSGDVIGTSPAGTDVYAYALDGEASVSIEGDVIMDLEPAVTDENGGTGVYSYATGESGAAEVTIEGSLNVSGEASDAHGIQSYAQADYEVWNEESETYTWVEVTSSSSSSTVSVGGDVAVSAESYVTGIEAAAEDGGTSVVTVDGTVNADILSSEESGSATGVYTNVEQASGTVEVTVGEDVLISGEARVSTGIDADVHASSTEWNEEAGEYLDTGLDSTTGTSDVTVGGDVTVFASDQATGIENHAAEGGVSTVTVEGSVYAEGNGEESADAIGVSSYAEDNGSSVVTVGEDVTVIAQNNADAVSAAVQNGGISEISVGGDVELDMTPSEAYADSRIVSAAASGDSGSASVSVEGDISVSGNPDHVVGVAADTHGSYSYYDSEAGEFVYVEIDSTSASASVTVGGDVTVSGEYGATGVSAESSEGGTSEVTVEGNVSSDAGHGDANANSCGVDALANKDGVTNVTVGGGVTATLDAAAGTAHAVDVTAQDGGEAVVTLNGDVSADSSADAIGLGVFSTQDATASVTVNGDVSADGRFAQGVAVTAHSNAQAVTIAAVGDIFEDPVVGAALPIVAKNAKDRIPRHRTERHDAARDIAAVKAFRNDEALIGYDLLPVFLGSRGVEQDIHAQISDVVLLFADENSFVVQMKRAPGASAFQGAGDGAYGRGLQMQQDGILYLAAQSFDRSTPLRQMLCVKQAVGFDLFCLSLTFESLEAVLDLGASLFASGDENVAGGMVSRADAAFQFGGLAAVKGALAVFRLHESAQFLRAHACQTLFLVPLRADALAAVYIARMIGKAEPEFPVTALDGLSFSESERDPTLLSFRFLFLQTDLKPAFKEIPRPFNDLFRAHVPGKLQLVEQFFRIGIQFVFLSQ